MRDGAGCLHQVRRAHIPIEVSGASLGQNRVRFTLRAAVRQFCPERLDWVRKLGATPHRHASGVYKKAYRLKGW